MVSVQRLLEYANLEAEKQPHRATGKTWDNSQNDENEVNSSTTGEVKFVNVEMRYKPHLMPALKGLNFSIESGMKVAVVGRTGAGKSTLYQLIAGFRTANQGKVYIDGMDVAEMDLDALRKELNIVHQQPFTIT